MNGNAWVVGDCRFEAKDRQSSEQPVIRSEPSVPLFFLPRTAAVPHDRGEVNAAQSA